MENRKPNTELKAFLIANLVEKLNVPQGTIEKIIAFQGEDALRAIEEYNEVEFSGFGKIMISQSKLKRKIEKNETAIERMKALLNSSTLSEVKRKRCEIAIPEIEESLKYLKTKIRENA